MGDNEKNFREKLRCENNDGTAVPDGIQEFLLPWPSVRMPSSRI